MEKLAYKGGKNEFRNTTKKGKRNNTYCACCDYNHSSNIIPELV